MSRFSQGTLTTTKQSRFRMCPAARRGPLWGAALSLSSGRGLQRRRRVEAGVGGTAARRRGAGATAIRQRQQGGGPDAVVRPRLALSGRDARAATRRQGAGGGLRRHLWHADDAARRAAGASRRRSTER